MRCEEFLERLDRLREGEVDGEVERHAQECADCAELLALVRGMRTLQRDARPDLIARAMAIMPKRARLVARLFGSSLAGAGVRSGREDDFVLHAGIEGVELHLQYHATGRTWTVTGRAPDAEWSLVLIGRTEPCGAGGRFRFTASSLTETGFILKKGETEVEFPAAPDLIGHGA